MEFNKKEVYSYENELKGVWAEPTLPDGESFGLQFLVLGFNAPETIVAGDKWQKELDRADGIEDPVESARIRLNATIDFVVAKTIDIRASDGTELLDEDGKKITKEDIPEIIRNAPVIRNWLNNFSMKTESFLAKRENV